MVSRTYFWRSLAVFCLLLLGLSSAFTQNAQGSGLVSDQKAAIPHATVEITNEAIQGSATVTSDQAGVYTAPSLSPGLYRVSIGAPGYETQTIERITVSVAGKLSLDVVLRPGSVDQTVMVDGSGLQIDTTDSAVGSVIDRQLVENIPLNGRSFVGAYTTQNTQLGGLNPLYQTGDPRSPQLALKLHF